MEFRAGRKLSPRPSTCTKIVIVVPAYNEENDIASLIARTNQQVARITNTFKIVVVDDGSSDKTRQILDILEVERFYHRHNLGKGDVIRNVLGFISPGEIVITMDGDGEHSPGDIRKIVQPIIEGKADMVIGSRFLNGHDSGELECDDPRYLGRKKREKFFKHFGNRFFTFMLWIFTHRRITDTQSGFRAFKAGMMQQLQLSADGFRIEMEMTVKAIKHGLRIKEVRIKNCQSARRSHLNPVVDGTRITLTVFREMLPPLASKFFDWLLPRVPDRLGRLFK